MPTKGRARGKHRTKPSPANANASERATLPATSVAERVQGDDPLAGFTQVEREFFLSDFEETPDELAPDSTPGIGDRLHTLLCDLIDQLRGETSEAQTAASDPPHSRPSHRQVEPATEEPSA
jgi:hypothetical protein